MSSNLDDYTAAALALVLLLRKKKRRLATHKKPNIQKRVQLHIKRCSSLKNPICLTYVNKELETTPLYDLQNCMRIERESFAELLEKVSPIIEKCDTNMRAAITSRQRLSVALCFLASGKSFEELKATTSIAPSTIGGIVMETVNALIHILKDYIKLPNNPSEWQTEAKAFDELWQFPNCIGALGGRYVTIIKRPGTGNYYLNQHKSHSLAFMAVVNANYEFLAVDVGANGGARDADLFKQNEIYQKLMRNELDIPNAIPLPKSKIKTPYVFISDETFPFERHIMRGFTSALLTPQEEIFNYRLARARTVVDNCFGIIASRFKILQNTIHVEPKKAKSIVLACCYLHNFLRRRNDELYLAGGFDMEHTEAAQVEYADWRQEPRQLQAFGATALGATNSFAANVRKHLLYYFNEEGAVSWQHDLFARLHRDDEEEICIEERA